MSTTIYSTLLYFNVYNVQFFSQIVEGKIRVHIIYMGIVITYHGCNNTVSGAQKTVGAHYTRHNTVFIIRICMAFTPLCIQLVSVGTVTFASNYFTMRCEWQRINQHKLIRDRMTRKTFLQFFKDVILH